MKKEHFLRTEERIKEKLYEIAYETWKRKKEEYEKQINRGITDMYGLKIYAKVA